MKDELLVVKKTKDKMKFKICDKEKNKWSPNRYEKIITGKDYNLLALIFFDLNLMGFNVEKAYLKFRAMLNEPDLFFLK